MTTIHNIPPSVLEFILFFLSFQEILISQYTCKFMRSAATSEWLWKSICLRDWNCQRKLDTTWKLTYIKALQNFPIRLAKSSFTLQPIILQLSTFVPVFVNLSKRRNPPSSFRLALKTQDAEKLINQLQQLLIENKPMEIGLDRDQLCIKISLSKRKKRVLIVVIMIYGAVQELVTMVPFDSFQSEMTWQLSKFREYGKNREI